MNIKQMLSANRILGIDKKVWQAVAKAVTFGTMQVNVNDERTWHGISGNRNEAWHEAYTNELYVYGCVYLIANTIASLPMRIYQDIKGKDGNVTKKDITATHPATPLIQKPNFIDSEFDIKEKAVANMELTGNTYMLLDGITAGKPKQIFILQSGKVEIIPNKQAGIENISDLIKEYKYSQTPYTVAQIIHEKKYNPDNEYYGLSPIKAGAVTIDSAVQAKQRNFNIFKNGVSSDGAFATEQPFNDVMYKRLQADIKEKYQNPSKAHTPMILFNGLKYASIGVTQKDLEYINGLKMTREEICGFLYQVPLILLGVLENASYNNIKEATKIFYNFSIIPRLVKMQELYQKLIDLYGVQGAYIEFDLSNVEALKESITDKLANIKSMVSMGTPLNMAYEYFGIPLKVDGGDIGYLPFGLQPIGVTPVPAEGKPVGEGTVVDETQGQGGPAKVVAKKIRKIVWSEELKSAKWKAFDARAKQIEDKYRKALVPYFKAQEAEIVANLGKLKALTMERIDTKHVAYCVADEAGRKKAINIESVLFDEKGQIDKLRKLALPYHAEAMKAQGQAELDLLNVDIAFDVSNPATIAYLKANGLKKAVSVVGTVKDAIKNELAIGVKEGESIGTLVQRINQNVYDGYEDLEGYELERIARTEVIGASNAGALDAYEQSGVVARKGWLATDDDRARKVDGVAVHLLMEEKYQDGIPLDEDFVDDATGAHGPAPAEMNLAEDSINCRCSIIPITGD